MKMNGFLRACVRSALLAGAAGPVLGQTAAPRSAVSGTRGPVGPVSFQRTTRVSVDSAEAQSNDDSYYPSVSADGRYVAFASNASNLVPGDTNGSTDVFVRDRHAGTAERVSVKSGSPSISADGRYVAFDSFASDLVPGDTNDAVDVFVHDRSSGTTERVSVDSAGAQGNLPSFGPSISSDGRYVAFKSGASNLVPMDTNGQQDVFVHDRWSGATERMSVDSAGTQGNGHSSYITSPSISADGCCVAFDSRASNLVPGDTNGVEDVFVHDLATGSTERVNVDSGGGQGNNFSRGPSISADGRYVAFENNVFGGDFGIFVRDRWTGVIEPVSVDSAGVLGNDPSSRASISSDGRYVAFDSGASNLVPGDTTFRYDVFVHDRWSGTTERVSVDSAGAESNGDTIAPSISADGLFVSFMSNASNLVPGDTNAKVDIFVRKR